MTLRVLHVINEMGTGGAEALVHALVEAGGSVGWLSAVVSSGGWRADELAAGGHDIHSMHRVERTLLSVATATANIRKAMRRGRPDVVVAHNILATIVARLALVLAGQRRPIVSVFHGVADHDYPRAAAVLDRASSAVVVVTEAIGQRLIVAGLRPEKVSVIRNAVPQRSVLDKENACERAGLDREVAYVLCAARLVPQKRHDVLLQAWAHARPEAVLLLAGDGPLRTELEEMASRLRVTDTVRFLGARTDVPALLGASELTVLASDWEGLPLSALEAMSAGRPVLATDVDGVSELLSGGAGALVPPGSPVELGRELAALLGAPDRRRELAARGRRVIDERHHPARMLDNYDTLFTELTKGPTR